MTRATGFSRRGLLGAAAALPIAGKTLALSTSPAFEVWLVRHGESVINVAPPPSAQEANPVRDEGISFPLTLRGLQQAKALARRVGDICPSAIFTSTRLRAIQTADALALALETPITLAPEIVEVDVGRLVASGAGGFADVYRHWLRDDDMDGHLPGGESRRQLEDRALPFLQSTITRYREIARPLIFVTHGALIGVVASRLFGNIAPGFALDHPIPNAGLIRGVRAGPGLHCVEWPGAEL
jgi:broad specificity phosphatase PhoE